MLGLIQSLIAFVLVISALVLVHELGHFAAARLFGIPVERFSIGFGRVLVSRFAWGTHWSLSLIPLGGYVVLDSTWQNASQKPRRVKAIQNIVVALLGPCANFLFAGAIYLAFNLLGAEQVANRIDSPLVGTTAERAGLSKGSQIIRVNTVSTRSWDEFSEAFVFGSLFIPQVTLDVVDNEGEVKRVAFDAIDFGSLALSSSWASALGLFPLRTPLKPVVGSIDPNGAGHRDGLKEGDVIVTIGGDSITDWQDVVTHVRESADKPLALKILRNGNAKTLTVIPKSLSKGVFGVGYIGVSPFVPAGFSPYVTSHVKYDFWVSVQQASARVAHQALITLASVMKVFTGEVSWRVVSGPIGIAKYSGVAMKFGIEKFLLFTAMLSVGIGVLNLLPIPVLDGGHVLCYVIELIRGKRMSDNSFVLLQKIGFCILSIFMFASIYNDLYSVVFG